MTRNKPLALAAIVGTAFILNACVSNNSGQGNNQPGYGNAPVDISDLYNGSEGHAKQQLSRRGFNQVGEKPGGTFNNSWWLNSRTRQCFQLETANGKVMTLNSMPLGDCHSRNGQ